MAPLVSPFAAMALLQETPELYLRLDYTAYKRFHGGFVDEVSGDFRANATPGGTSQPTTYAFVSGFTGDGNLALQLKAGANDYVTVGNPSDGRYLPGSGDPFTVSVWFKTSSATRQVIYGRYLEASGHGWSVFVRSDGKVEFKAVDVNGATLWDVVTSGTYADGVAHHVVVVGAVLATAASLYIDGVLVGQTSVYDAAVIADGATSYWKLNVDAVDSGSGAHNGTIAGSAPFAAAGPFMDATNGILLNGSTGKITVAPAASTTTFTIEFWVNPDASQAATNGAILQNAAQTVGVYYKKSTGAINVIYGGADHVETAAHLASQWFHVVISISGGTGTFYINGAINATFAAFPGFTPTNIGGITGDFFKGSLAKLAIYNGIALTATQAITHYLNAKAKGYPASEATMGYRLGGSLPDAPPLAPLIGTLDDLSVYPYGFRSAQVTALYAGRTVTKGSLAPQQARAGAFRSGMARADGARQQAVVSIGGAPAMLAKKGTLQITDVLDQPSTADFTIEYMGTVYSPVKLVAGQTVLIGSGAPSNRVFGGTVVRARSLSLKNAQAHVAYRVSAADWRFLFNKRLVVKSYPVGMSSSDVVIDIVNNFTTDGFTTRHVKPGGPAIATAPLVFLGVKAFDALLQIKQQFGWNVRIDAYQDVHYYDVEPLERITPIDVANGWYDVLEYEEDLTQTRTAITATGPTSTTTAAVAAGATSIPVAEVAVFIGFGLNTYNGGNGFLTPYGDVVTFTGISAVSGPGNLTGVPASGAGSVKTPLKSGDALTPLAGHDLVPAVSGALVIDAIAAREGGYAQLIALRSAEMPGWWRLSDRDGLTAVDAKVAGVFAQHNGTYSSGVTLGVAGPLADGTTGATFDGAAGNVNIGNVADFSFTKAFSIEAWVKATATPALAVIVGKLSQAIDRGWAVFWYSGVGKIQFFAASTTGTDVWNFLTDLAYNDGNWHHLVCTYDGTTTAGGVVIYVDGVPVKTATAAAAAIGTTTDPMRIGSYGNGSAGFFNGSIKDVAAYNRYLNPSDVAEAYQARLKAASAADGRHQYLLPVSQTADLYRAWQADYNANNGPTITGKFWTMNPQTRVGRQVQITLPARGITTPQTGVTIQRVTRTVAAAYRWQFVCDFANIWRDLTTVLKSFR